jgi:hypothetical protein
LINIDLLQKVVKHPTGVKDIVLLWKKNWKF